MSLLRLVCVPQPCPAGSYCVGDAAPAVPCPAGTWSGASAGACTSCDLGTFSTDVGAESAATCLVRARSFAVFVLHGVYYLRA